MLSGLLRPSNGDIFYKNESLVKNRELVQKILGVCTQNDPLFPYMTIREHMYLYAKIKNINKSVISKQIDDLSKEVGLYKQLDKLTENLSGG